MLTATKEMVGTTPNGSLRNQNGLDDIDRWAMGLGSAEKDLNSIRPNKKREHLIR